jgi:uncharacterized membrane protein
VIGNVAASQSSTPKTWVAVLDIVAGALLLVYVVRAVRRPVRPDKEGAMVARVAKLTSSSAVAVIGAGAALANAGAFIPIALKDISQTDPTAAEFVGLWVTFALVALLPLAAALVMLLVARDRTARILAGARTWLERNARTVAAGIVVILAIALLRNGVSALT